MRSTRSAPALSLVVATALALAACGGGGDKSATTTSAPPAESTSTSGEPTTTSTTIDPELQALLLTETDLPTGFKEAADDPSSDDEASACDTVDAPATKAIEDEPSAEGASFERGSGAIPVQVSSTVTRTTPEKAEAAMAELLDAKLRECLEADLRTAAESSLPAGGTVTFNTTSARANVTGTDQAVLLSSTATIKAESTTAVVRSDFVFLRKDGTLYIVFYAGLNDQATAAERQRIVAAAARKLGGTASGTSTTSASGGSTSSTSSSGRTSTSRGSTSSSRRSTTSTTRSGGTTSTT